MTDRERFASVMLSLSLALQMYGRELTKAMQDVYWKALAGVSDDELEAAAQIVIRSDKEFPSPARLLELARPPVESAAQAHRVMALAWEAGRQVIPGQGTWWSGVVIREKIGEAAYEAFHACGGSAAFRDMDDPYHGSRIRREFVECWRRVVMREPATALRSLEYRPALPAPAQPALAFKPPKQFLPLIRPDRLPCTAEEQAALDRIGEKLEHKRAAIPRVSCIGELLTTERTRL